MSSKLIFKNFRLLDPRRESLVQGLEPKIEDGEVTAVAEHIPRDERAEVIDLGKSTTSIFGGVAPKISTLLIQQTSSPLAPTGYLLSCPWKAFGRRTHTARESGGH